MRLPSRSAALLLAALAPLVPAVSGHTHIEIVHRDGALRLVHYDFDSGESDPATLRIHVGLPAAHPVPDLPAFTNLLGEAGSTTWVLPQKENGEVLWLGIGSGTLVPAEFVGSLQLKLTALDGPGHFTLFFDDAFGRPVTVMDTRDGVGPADAMTIPLGSHLHCNWAFSAPGLYRLQLLASGTLRSGSVSIVSAPTDFFFEVEAPPPPVLSLERTSGGGLELSLQAHPGLNWVLEAGSALPNWIPFAQVLATAPVTRYPLASSLPSPRFFRTRLR